MKIKQSIFLVVLISFALASCRKEETEFIQAPEEETLNPNSNVALLMQRTASNDGSEVTINNLNELETAIENADNTCDEDDDYDYEDDDCDNCTLAMVEELLLNCSDWEVDKLERNNNDYDNLYDGYEFNFFSNGTMSVYWSGITADGTWVASGSGNDIEIIVNVPDLPLCNNNWILHEIENCSDETKIDLRVGDADRLRYINNCN